MLNSYRGIFGLASLAGLTALLPAVYAADSSTLYAIADTGQTKCYNASTEVNCPATGVAFYGQDAQFTGNAPHYTLSANGMTVYDNVTGLTWQRSPETNGDGSLTKADKKTYANALAYCAAQGAANYQGFNDWRLPAIKELYSLIDFRGADPSGYSGTDTSGLTPFIDKSYFNYAYGDVNSGERIIDSQYASSTAYVDNPAGSANPKLFGVNFADGRIKGYDLVMPGSAEEKTFFVQCVRGNTSYGINAFVDNGDQTITDHATALMWTKPDSGMAMNWQNALAWVQTQNAANYLGHNDWRMPNAKELQSILDYSRSPATTNSAAINPIFNATAFINEGGQTDWPWYWASTTHAAFNGMGAAGVYLAFGRATGWQKATPNANCYTLYDVHGAGAQRSDPKTSSGVVTIGTACSGGAAYGFGPQGDVQRATNHVRLVRGTASPIPGSAIGVFRNGAWFLDANGNGQWDGCQQNGGQDLCLFDAFGAAGDMPAPGNWDGGGKSYPGVLRAGTGQWFIDRNGNRQWDGCDADGCYEGFGAPGDLPVAGDWSRTGGAKIGLFRNGQWFLDSDGDGKWDGCGADLCLSFGQTGDLPVAGDWSGSGLAGVGVFRAGTWYLDYNGNGKWDGCQQDGGQDLCLYGSFGQAGDLPVAGDWNGDEKAKVGIFRNGAWYLDYNGNGVWDGCQQDGGQDQCLLNSFGQKGDLPVAGQW